MNKTEVIISARKTQQMTGKAQGEIPLERRSLLIEGIQTGNGGVINKKVVVHPSVYRKGINRNIRIRFPTSHKKM